MDRTSFHRFQAWLSCVVGCLLLSIAAPAGAQDAASRKKIAELNEVTGGDTIAATIKLLAEHRKESKKLLADALLIAKESAKKSPPVFNYNGAIILAQFAQEINDLPACEVFYRIAMVDAAKLLSTTKLLESYGGLVEALYQSKKYAESAKVCRQLLELHSNDGKDRDYYVASEGRGGETRFEEFDDYDPTKRLQLPFKRQLVQSLSKQGKFTEALKIADELVNKYEGHWLMRQLRASVLQEAGKYKEAAEAYEDAIEAVEKDDSLKDSERDRYLEVYRYILSGVYLDMNKVDRATDLLQKLLAQKPNNPGYNNDLGYIWADHDMKLEESEKLIRKALDLDRKQRKAQKDLKPEDDHDNGAYLDSLGWVLYKQKRYKEAKEVLRKAVEDKTTQHLEIYDHLGDVLWALNEREAAIAAWRRGIELASESRRDRERKALVEKKLQMNK